jgi:uncharacterized membrane protein
MQLGITGNKAAAHSDISKETWSLENFIGLRLIHLIGIVVLVIGLSIGVKYAIDRNLISELMRISLAYAAGFVLYILSARLKKDYLLFSAILFSGGMASLYFTTYGAFVYYAMMPFAVAFIIMIGLTVLTVYQAIIYNRQEIALLGLTGAYAIPFLISRNAERAELFFLYISVINLGVVYLCTKKRWQSVGWIAQVITWVLFIGWASMRFNHKQQWIGFVFMSFFFLLFLVNALSQRIFQKRELALNNVYQLVVNNLAVYIAALFVFGSSFINADLAVVTIMVSLLLSAQALALHYVWGEEQAKRILASFSFILFIVFIALWWTGLTVTLLWLLIAIIVFALGVIKRSSPLRMASIILMGATLLKLVVFDSLSFSTVQKVISYLVLGVLLLVVSYLYQKYKQQLFDEGKR